jgi:hypothetical protein
VIKLALTLSAALALAQPVSRAGADTPRTARAKPSSFVPHAATTRHVYGAPIEPAIVGHIKHSRGKRKPQRPSSGS